MTSQRWAGGVTPVTQSNRTHRHTLTALKTIVPVAAQMGAAAVSFQENRSNARMGHALDVYDTD